MVKIEDLHVGDTVMIVQEPPIFEANWNPYMDVYCGRESGYDEDFTQTFNTPSRIVFDDLKYLGVRNIKIITPEELDELRGYHKPSMQEYLGV